MMERYKRIEKTQVYCEAAFTRFTSTNFILNIITILLLFNNSQHCKALKWGMIGFEDTQTERPEFQGIPMKSFIDGRRMEYFAKNDFRLRVIASWSAIMAFVFMVICVIASIYYMRFALAKKIGEADEVPLSLKFVA